MRNTRTLVLVEAALAVALSVVLNLLAMRLPIHIAGGSISLTMLPIALVALRRGSVAGAAAGTIFGFLDLLMEPFILVPAQVALDYPVPYLLFGLGVGLFSGLYHKGVGKPTTNPILSGSAVLVCAVLVGGVLRYVTHVLSGVLFFAEYAGDQNVWAYSLIYNISYLGPSLAVSLVCALLILPILNHAVPVVSSRKKEAHA
ncbi:MAG: energy-coupled thiamine transporter ThiT [Coriobacteriales bacterium]|jgi:thiamine transporter|nr:energy-coupled thiamine transporter ThiT [Coriobacteriales bacterium]